MVLNLPFELGELWFLSGDLSFSLPSVTAAFLMLVILKIMFWITTTFYGIHINLYQRIGSEMGVENFLHLYAQLKMSNSFLMSLIYSAVIIECLLCARCCAVLKTHNYSGPAHFSGQPLTTAEWPSSVLTCLPNIYWKPMLIDYPVLGCSHKYLSVRLRLREPWSKRHSQASEHGGQTK